MFIEQIFPIKYEAELHRNRRLPTGLTWDWTQSFNEQFYYDLK